MANSAMMGAAYHAKYGLLKKNENINYEKMMENLSEPELVCKPYEDAEDVSGKQCTIFVKQNLPLFC